MLFSLTRVRMINVNLPKVLKSWSDSLITCNDDRTPPYTAIFIAEGWNFSFTKGNVKEKEKRLFSNRFPNKTLPACHWSDKQVAPPKNSHYWLSCCHARLVGVKQSNVLIHHRFFFFLFLFLKSSCLCVFRIKYFNKKKNRNKTEN